MITAKDVVNVVLAPWPLYNFGKREDGKLHCLSLIRYVYHHLGVDLAVDYMNFIEVFRALHEGETPAFPDVVIMSMHFPFPDHAGICLGGDTMHDGLFAQVNMNNSVTINRLNDSLWQRVTKGVIRYRKVLPC